MGWTAWWGLPDATGNLIGSQRFDTWGNPTQSSGAGVPVYGFTGASMKAFRTILAAAAMLLATQSPQAGTLDPAAVQFVPASEIEWVRNAAGTNETAVLHGDPRKPGPYVVRLKWLPGNMSRPHFHPNAHYFIVISGTWWMGTGEKFDPDNTVPAPAGRYVVHHAGKIHYDGARNEEVIVQVCGMGPGTSTPAEKK